MNISTKDRLRLREVARLCAELAASERNQRLWNLWMQNGSSKAPIQPTIRIETHNYIDRLLQPFMQCEGPEARAMEKRLMGPWANFTLFEDDTIMPAYYGITDHLSFVPFGLPVRRQETGGVGHHFIPYLRDLESDEHLLGASVYSVDEAAAEAEMQLAGDLFGDLLPPRRISNCSGCCLTQDIVHIMNMDDMYIAMVDDEERFHAMMRRLTDDYIAFFQMLEDGKHLHGGARMQHLNQGSYCFTNELPDGEPGTPNSQRWLFMDSQETAAISPSMYRDLVFPYYKDLMSRFGLVSYGCCEASHPIWEECLSTVPNLRKVSISPWCDEELMGERLRGTGITYVRKPPATLVGMDTPYLDEEASLACFRKTAKAASGCKLEIAQRDVYLAGLPRQGASFCGAGAAGAGGMETHCINIKPHPVRHAGWGLM